MLLLLLTWASIGIALAWLVAQKGRDSAGLPLAYFLGLSLIHVPGAMLYLDGDDVDSLEIATRIGFEQTVIGMFAFMCGALIARAVSGRNIRPPERFRA